MTHDANQLQVNFLTTSLVFRLNRMHEMQTIVTDFHGVCQSVCHAAGSFGATVAKSLWPIVKFLPGYAQTDLQNQFFLCFNDSLQQISQTFTMSFKDNMEFSYYIINTAKIRKQTYQVLQMH